MFYSLRLDANLVTGFKLHDELMVCCVDLLLNYVYKAILSV